MINYPIQQNEDTEGNPAPLPILPDDQQLVAAQAQQAAQSASAPQTQASPPQPTNDSFNQPLPPPDDTRLADAQAAGNKQRMYSNLLRGFQQALQGSAAGSGFKADTGAADALERQAGIPEEQAKAQLASEAQAKKTAQDDQLFQMKLKDANLNFQDDQANSDPKSSQSKIAQDRVIEKQKEMGQPVNEDQIRSMSGKDLFQIMPYLHQDLVQYYTNQKQEAEQGFKEKELKSKETMEGQKLGVEREKFKQASEDKATAAEDKANQKATENDNKDAMKLNDALDKGWAARGGQAGQVQQKLNSAEAAETLIEQAKTQPGGMDSRQIEELAQSTARLIGGNNAASARVEALIPHTMLGRAQTLKEFLTNNPQGQEMQDFVARLGDTIAREKALANSQKQQYQVETLAAHKRLKESNPDLFNEIISSKGLSPDMIDEKGRYKKPGATGPLGDTTVRNGQTYKWNASVGKYQLLGQPGQ